MRFLVTGFEAFGKDSINPTQLMIEKLTDKLGDVSIDTLRLPVIASQAEALLDEALINDYDGIILLGVARGRTRIALERVAINVDDYRIPDNLGETRIDEPIDQDGPAAYFTTLPIREMERVLKSQGINAAVSNTAGTYLCNHIFYYVQNQLAKQHKQCKCGFVHVPAVSEMVLGEDVPSMSIDMLHEALYLMLLTLYFSFHLHIAVSACLLGHNCKYSGGNNYHPLLNELLKGKDVIAVCPEVSGGMTTPRKPSEQNGDSVFNCAGEDVTQYFERGAQLEFQRVLDAGVTLAVLQARSPSCGIDIVYDGSFSKTLIPGDGVFVRTLKKTAIQLISSADIGKKR